MQCVPRSQGRGAGLSFLLPLPPVTASGLPQSGVQAPQSLQLFGQILAVQEHLVLEVASGPFCWQ